MPRDVPLDDGSLSDEHLVHSTAYVRAAPGRMGPVFLRSNDVRELALRREIARLTRERNSLLRSVEQERPAALNEPAGERTAARLAAKDNLIRALFASRSWRMTAPLRAVSRLSGRGPAATVELALAQTDAVTSADSTASPSHHGCGSLSVQRRPEGQSRGEVLIVAPHLPLFDRQGGGLRLKTLTGMIAELGWTVTFCCSSPADWGPDFLASPQGRAGYERPLRASGVERFVYGIEDIRAFLIESGGRMRYAFLSFPDVASDVTPLIRSYCPWARVIFDTVDLHFLRMQREATLRGDPLLAREAERMRQLELSCMRSADVTVAISEDERRLLLDLVPEAVVETVPIVFRLPPGPPVALAGRAGLLFVGGFWHAPNGDAVLWFVEHIWPRIRAQAPDAVFRIVGSDPTPEVMALGQMPGVEVLGHVPDLIPLFDAARVFVAPLRFGAGMKGKVGQSLVNGLPVVATAIGAEGMSLVDGEHALIADAPEAFAECVLTLLEDDALWRRLQAKGRALIASTLSEAVVAQRLDTLFRV